MKKDRGLESDQLRFANNRRTGRNRHCRYSPVHLCPRIATDGGSILLFWGISPTAFVFEVVLQGRLMTSKPPKLRRVGGTLIEGGIHRPAQK